MWPSAISPSPKAALTRATTFSQFVISTAVFFLFSSVYSPPVPLSTASFPSVNYDFSTAASPFLTSTNHPFKCSARIPEGPRSGGFVAASLPTRSCPP